MAVGEVQKRHAESACGSFWHAAARALPHCGTPTRIGRGGRTGPALEAADGAQYTAIMSSNVHPRVSRFARRTAAGHRCSLSLLVLALTLVVAGCGGGAGGGGEEAAAPSPEGGDADAAPVRKELVMVDTVELSFAESGAPTVLVRGRLSSTCYELQSPRIRQEEDMFLVLLEGEAPAEAECGPEPQPVEEAIDLDVADLPAGDYVVDVNGRREVISLSD